LLLLWLASRLPVWILVLFQGYDLSAAPLRGTPGQLVWDRIVYFGSEGKVVVDFLGNLYWYFMGGVLKRTILYFIRVKKSEN